MEDKIRLRTRRSGVHLPHLQHHSDHLDRILTTPLCSPQALLRFITDLGLGVVDPGVGHVGKDFPFEVVLDLA